MKKKILKRLCLIFTALSLFCLGLAGCDKTAQKQEKVLKIAYGNWAEGVAVVHLVQYLLKDKMDIEAELTMADVAPIFAAVASGQQDLFIETWMPVTHQPYFEKYGDKIHRLGEWFTGAKIGLVVPTYVKANSITELNQYKSEFDGQIIGIDPGTGLMKTTEKVIEAYKLDYKLVAASGPAMTASLKRAIDRKEPVIVTGWAPHWKFAKWNLKFLDDPKSMYGVAEKIHMAARKNFEKDWPEVTRVFQKMKFNGKQIGSLMNVMKTHKKDPQAAVREWAESHRELVDSWFQK